MLYACECKDKYLWRPEEQPNLLEGHYKWLCVPQYGNWELNLDLQMQQVF